MLEHVPYDIILELCELARNMSWLDGLVLIWLWHGHGFNLIGTNSILFLFLLKKNWYGMNMKRWGEP